MCLTGAWEQKKLEARNIDTPRGAAQRAVPTTDLCHTDVGDKIAKIYGNEVSA